MKIAESGSILNFAVNGSPLSAGACAPSSVGPWQLAHRWAYSAWPRVACASLKMPSWTVRAGACAPSDGEVTRTKTNAAAASAVSSAPRRYGMRGILAQASEPRSSRPSRSSWLRTSDGRSLRFNFLPLRFHLVQRRVADRFAARRECLLDGVEACGELFVGPPQRRLRLDAQLPREIGDRKQQVAHLLLGARQMARRARFDFPPQLRHLLLDLVEDVRRPCPVEAYRRGAGADLVGAQQ